MRGAQRASSPHDGAALLGIWTLASLMSVGSGALQYAADGQAVPWGRIWSEAAGWFLWVPLFPLVFWAVRRFPLGRASWVGPLFAHLGVGAGVALLYALLVVLKNSVILGLATGVRDPHPLANLPGYLFGGLQLYLVVYGLLVAALHASDSYRRLRERELLTSRLEAQLSKAQLQTLKLQLDPHFLFNALNAIAALVHSDPDGAERMTGLVADFLRLSLTNSHRQEVTLAEELEFLNLYLEIEKVRFGDRLSVRLDIAPELAGTRVPNLILQPLVENAIRHGMRSRPLRVEVKGRSLSGARVELRVDDDGAGPAAAGGEREGVGLSNTRARLRQLYGAEHEFSLRAGEAGGAVATVVLPWRNALHETAQDEGSGASLIVGVAPAPGL